MRQFGTRKISYHTLASLRRYPMCSSTGSTFSWILGKNAVRHIHALWKYLLQLQRKIFIVSPEQRQSHNTCRVELDYWNYHFPRDRHTGDGRLIDMARNLLLGNDDERRDSQHGRWNLPEHRVRNGSKTTAKIHRSCRAWLKYQRNIRDRDQHSVRLDLVIVQKSGNLLFHHGNVRHTFMLRHLLCDAIEPLLSLSWDHEWKAAGEVATIRN